MSEDPLVPPREITNAKVVFLTGAGASVPLGLPSTAQFLRLFKDQGVRSKLPDAQSQQDLFGFITDRLHVANPSDIEHVLARLESNAEWTAALAAAPFFGRLLLEGAWNDRSYTPHSAANSCGRNHTAPITRC